jgi:hypothetical protein
MEYVLEEVIRVFGWMQFVDGKVCIVSRSV